MVVELTDSEVAELQDATGQTDPALAVRTAMREYLRHVRRMQLKTLSRQVEMDDNWRELEADCECTDLILIDTCIGIPFFTRPDHAALAP